MRSRPASVALVLVWCLGSTGCSSLLDSPLLPNGNTPRDCVTQACEEPAVRMGAATPKDGAAIEPIVLLHGFAGFRRIGNLFDYFYRVIDAYDEDGTVVFATQVDPFQSISVRATELADQIDTILRHTGARRVNLVAHSQGGLDARYLISTLGYGDRVRSLTTIGTPHRGTKLVDAALGLVPGKAAAAAAAVLDSVAGIVTGHDSDILAQLADLSCASAAAFTVENPDDPRVEYYSYSGSTQTSWLVDTDVTDIVTPFLWPSYRILASLEGENDGVVSVQSAAWGSYLGVLPADHWDEVGLLPGTSRPAFDHIAFYRGLASFLDGRGAPPVY